MGHKTMPSSLRNKSLPTRNIVIACHENGAGFDEAQALKGALEYFGNKVHFFPLETGKPLSAFSRIWSLLDNPRTELIEYCDSALVLPAYQVVARNSRTTLRILQVAKNLNELEIRMHHAERSYVVPSCLSAYPEIGEYTHIELPYFYIDASRQPSIQDISSDPVLDKELLVGAFSEKCFMHGSRAFSLIV